MQLMLDDRFWAKVDKEHPSGCWVWTANKNNQGYGMFRPGGLAPKRLAHRLAFEDAHGPIPAGGIILHSCDNPRCVNPDHLRVGNYKDNVADMDQRGRRVINPARGEAKPNTSMTDDRVIAIRKAYVSGVPISEIRTCFGVSDAAFHDYVSGKSFAHVLGRDGSPDLAALKSEARRRRRNNARLDQATADEIRRRLASGERGVKLAAEYGVHKATISDIKRNKIWPPYGTATPSRHRP